MFLKAWIPVSVAQLYNPVTSLLLPVGAKDVWKGMKTVGELKRERGIQNTVNPDHIYRVSLTSSLVFLCSRTEMGKLFHIIALWNIFMVCRSLHSTKRNEFIK